MLRVAHYTLAAACIALTLVGCQDAASPHDAAAPLGAVRTMSRADAAAPLESLLVKPTDTDPAIQKALSEHYVWLDPAARHRKKLFVHMPGARNTPSSFRLLAKEAARLGYHVIVLTYVNDWDFTICNADPTCEENVRMEVIDGITRTAPFAVNPPDGIYNRLTKLLVYLANNRPPDEGWSNFLDHGAPAWKRIAISGSSSGGAEAAMLAKLHRVRRVTLFAAPRDTVPGGLPPAWVALGATPAQRYYGLVHDRDPLVAATLASWPLLGMSQFGDPVYEDASAPPYGGTHSLLTHRLPSSGSYLDAHPSVSRDQFTPIGPDGTPLLSDAWRHLLGADEGDEEVAGDQDEQSEAAVGRSRRERQ